MVRFLDPEIVEKVDKSFMVMAPLSKNFNKLYKVGE